MAESDFNVTMSAEEFQTQLKPALAEAERLTAEYQTRKSLTPFQAALAHIVALEALCKEVNWDPLDLTLLVTSFVEDHVQESWHAPADFNRTWTP